jgi:hypothetical protein
LFDLLTVEEDSDYEKRFDIDLLASRLIETTEWLMNHDEAKVVHRLFGASTGAASALRAFLLVIL